MSRLEAVILDWAGTTVDFGSLAPVRAVTGLFAREGVPVSDAEARRDMGIFKKDHIRKILSIPRVEAAWRAAKHEPPAEADVEDLFSKFIPLQMEVLLDHSQLIFGAGRVAENLKGRGLRIGATTGYPRAMLDALLDSAAEQGYRHDVALCPDDVGEGGRPLPWMCWRIALEFRLSSVAAAVKIGDTASDIEEARNAGMWAVGVAATGNEIGMSAADFAALPEHERRRRITRAREKLKAAGAHFVVDGVAVIEPVLVEIGRRLEAGERP
jgi:phosphonoacetaldehyde hydrolase